MSTSSTENVVVSDSTSLLNVSMTNVTKLTATNYLIWHRQVHALLDGYDLAGYLDGSVAAPEPTLTVSGTISPNPAYKIWKRQDKLIYSGLLGTISVSVQALLPKTTTSAEIWEKLKSTDANPSRGHILQLREQIKHWKKGTKSVDEYFQGFTIRFDQLAMLGTDIPHEDQLDFILGGLTDDYKQVIDQIGGRDTPPSLTELHEKLINHELKLQTLVTASASVPATANAASYKPSNNYRNNSNKFQGRG